MSDYFFLTNKTKSTTPSLPFGKMKNNVLGKKYDLSLVFIGDKKSKALNKKYKNKEDSTNILSFPLDKKTGEIFINLKKAKKDALVFEKNERDFLKYLFLHGLLHLKGFKHGKKMEKEEDKYIKLL